MKFRALVFLMFMTAISSISAQEMVGDWRFHPNYTLNRNAANYPGHKIDPPKSRFELFKTLGRPIHFYDQVPSQRITDFLDSQRLPRDKFTVEFWMLNHVNTPVGAMMNLRHKKSNIPHPWMLGYYRDEISFHLSTQNESKTLRAKIQKGWKRYWGHLVASFDGKEMRLFFNGELMASASIDGGLDVDDESNIELSGYFTDEPFMEISNLLKAARLYDYALPPEQIEERFLELQMEVESGALFPDIMHFNAGPYLHYSTQNSINMVWETNVPSTAVIRYGTTMQMDVQKEIRRASTIHEITLDDLDAASLYYYEIECIGPDGRSMKSGPLTFKTASRTNDPFSFCIIGDTESRPQINHQLGEMIWEERPNFILHLGDITDGGKKPHKFEWNYEYFTGIVPVASRLPVFPVAGNGEGDLYWYKKYHKLPDTEAYYSFEYGNAEFFMLNTNADEELQKGGVQYKWLKEKLKKSKARWKFVAHHHCPVSSDENDFGNTWKGEKSTSGDPRFDDIKTVYEEGGVDIVFFGHVHAYERTHPMKNGMVDKKNGVVYLQSGGGGGNLEDFVPGYNVYSTKVQRGHHFCKVDIFENEFTLKMFDIEGRLKDVFEVKK